MEQVDPSSRAESSAVPDLYASLSLPYTAGSVEKGRVVKALIEAGADCDRRDNDNLTACERALVVQGDRELAGRMIEAELKRSSSVDRAFYVMIRRGSLRVFRLFLEVGNFTDGVVYEKVARGLIELSAKRVDVDRELEAFLRYRLAEYAFRELSGGLASEKNADEWRMHFAIIAANWKVLKEKFGDRDYAAVDNEFIHRIGTIHNHLYFVKDKRFLKHLPMMEIVFCLAMFVSICRWNERFKMHTFMIDKLKVMQYLDVICKHLDRVNLHLKSFGEKLRIVVDSFESKYHPSKEQVMSRWMNIYPTEQLEENVINRIVNGFKRKLDHKVIIDGIISSENFAVPSSFNRRDRSFLKRLRRTYFQAKQLYSIDKCIHHIDSLPTKSVEAFSDPAVAAAMKRVIQVLGEAIKNTKNSPNVPKKVANALERMLTMAFPESNKFFREFFSHKYSLMKQFLYEQPDTSFTMITKFIGHVKMIFSLLFVCSTLEASRSLLGSMRRCKTNKRLRSLLQYVGDLTWIEKAQTKHFERLEDSFRTMSEALSGIQVSTEDKRANLQRLMCGLEKKSAILRKLSSCLIGKWKIGFEEIKRACYGGADISTVHAMIKWNLVNYGQNEIYEAIEYHWQPDHDTLVFLGDVNDTNVHNPSVMGGMLSYIKLVGEKIEGEKYLHNSVQILKDLGQTGVPEEFVNSFHKSMQKYYENIFFLDNKFKVIKQLFKTNKHSLDGDLLKQMRLRDKESLQRIYDNRVADMRKLLFNQDIVSVEDMAAKISRVSNQTILALEYCQLELCEMLISVGYFGDNFDLLKHRIPMISGRNYRNYLAHDSLSYNVLTESDRSKVLINALVMLNNPVKLFERLRTKEDKCFTFPQSEEVLNWVTIQTELGKGILSKNFTLVQQCVDQETELTGKFCTVIDTFESLKFAADWQSLLNQVSPDEELKRLLKCFGSKNTNPRALPKQQTSNVSTIPGNVFYRDEINENLFRDLLTINERDQQNRPLLHRFVLAGNVKRVLQVFSSITDLNVDAADTNGSTALDIALHLGFLHIAQLLLTKNPRISTANRELAIVNHLNDLLPQLFKDHLDELPPDESCIMVAVQTNNLTALEFIVQHLYPKSGEKLRNQHLSSAISQAAYFNHSRIIEYLLSLPDTDFFSSESSESSLPALHHAIHRRNWPIVKLLLNRGASPNWKNPNKLQYTAFQLAVAANSRRVLRMMKNIDRELYCSLEHPMSIAIRIESPKLVSFLQKMGFTVLDSNRIIQTAVRCGNMKFVDCIFHELDAAIQEWKQYDGVLGQVGQLLSRLAAISYLEERESYSITPVLQAIDVDNWEIMRVLLDKSRVLRKMDEWFISDIELYRKNGMKHSYGSPDIIQESGMLCDCKKLLARLKDYTANGRRICPINSFHNSDEVKIDCYLATARNTDDFNPCRIQKQSSLNAIYEMIKSLINESNDIVFGTVHEADSNLLRYFVVSSDSFYVVRLTSTEPPQPLRTLVNAGDKNGESPLHMMAIRKDSPQTLKFLLDNGANPIAMNSFGVTPLHIALVDEKDFTSMLYLNHCVEHNLKSPDGTSALELPNGQRCRPIHYAAMFGKLAAVQFLLKHNVNLRVLDHIGYHPTCYAAGRGFSRMLRLFLEQDPTLIDLPDSRGQTLLHISTKSEDEETILMLLEYDVAISAVDYEGKSPVEIAIGNVNVPWLKIVMFYARVNGIRGLLDNASDNKMSVLHYAMFSNKIELLTALVEYETDADFGSDLSTESLEKLRKMLTRTVRKLGYTALHIAVQLNFKESVKFLMSCQAWHNRQSEEKIRIEQDALDLKGRTPLDYALDGTDETMISLLLYHE